MTDEYKIDGTVIAEKDGSGNFVIKNIESLETKDLNNAKQASEYSSIQSAINAAGQNGTVHFDPAGAPYTFGATPTLYDGLTIILSGDINGDGSSFGAFFDLSGHTGITIVPNGHTLDGQSRSSGVNSGVKSSSTTSDCHIEGVIKVRRVRSRGVSLQGDELTADTVIVEQMGDKANNDSNGDAVNFGSIDQATECEVGTVIATDVARHTVTFGSKNPQECSVDTVKSTDPGGAHVAFEEADRSSVGEVIGSGARQAINYSSPASTYNDYPELNFADAGVSGTNECTVERANIRDPVGGTGPAVGFGNGTQDNSVDDLTAINPANDGVEFGTGAGGGPNNSVGVRRIQGAGFRGVAFSTQAGCEVYGVGKGIITECQQQGVESTVTETTIEGLEIFANGQDGSTTEAMLFDTDITGLRVSNCRIEDGSSGAQSEGVVYDSSITVSQDRFVGNDFSGATDAYVGVGTPDGSAANTPSP